MSNQYTNMPSLSGQKFGRWTAGEETKSASGRRSYLCTCECGKQRSIDYGKLHNGTAKQCASCRNTRQICVKGHDTNVCGRSSTGKCRMCAKGDGLLSKYGITIEEYEALYKSQNGKCAICGRELLLIKGQDLPNVSGRAEVDHKHLPVKERKKVPKKSTVRGLLCGGRWAGCNAKLGRVDKLEWLKAAVAYIENPPAQQLFRERINVR